MREAASRLSAALASPPPNGNSGDDASVDELFQAAVDREVRARLAQMLDGIEAYRHHPWRRTLPDVPVIWQQGTTRMLDYNPAGSPAVLVVPSLVNRCYVLDLMEGRSLTRWLAAEGLRPLLVDWDAPGDEERRFDLTAYISGRLEAALDAAVELTGGPLPVMGYCMGGNLTLALAVRRPRDVSGLSLFATPWDFHADRVEQALAIGEAAKLWAAGLETLGELPVDAMQALFYTLDPLQVVRKFLAFATFADSPKAEPFVALEDWLNDGMPLSAPVARECLVGWYGENTPARLEWRIAGRPVDPADYAGPTLAMIPEGDRIVPPESARALTANMPNATNLVLPLGHIGMVVAGKAPEMVWKPFRDWVREVG